MRRTSLRPEQINQAARLYQDGWSTAHIAEHLNTHQRTVQRRLAEKDVTMHGTNRRRFKPAAGQGLGIVDLPFM
jgi:IS30 family transposase